MLPVGPGVAAPRPAVAGRRHFDGDQVTGIRGRGAPVPRFRQRHRAQETGDLPRRGDAEAIDRRRACPVDVRAVVGHRQVRIARHHPFGEVVGFLEVLAPRDRQRPAAPQDLQRRFLRLPLPPAPAGPGVALEVTRLQRALGGDAVDDVRERLRLVAAEVLGPPRARQTTGPEPLETNLPVAEPLAGDRRRIVGPVLEERPVPLQQVTEHARLIAVEPARQDQVVRALDDVDRVNLDVPQLLHNFPDDCGSGLPGRVVEQTLCPEEQTPGGGRVDGWDGSRRHEGNSTVSRQLL